MERLISDNKTYRYYEYTLGNEFEQIIVQKSKQIFGSNTVYIDIKKKIGDAIVTIPDGYLIVFPNSKNIIKSYKLHERRPKTTTQPTTLEYCEYPSWQNGCG
jgi:hypothetical protein